jgi:hypothetical protein
VKSGFEDLVPAQDRTMRQRLAAFRDVQIDSFLKVFRAIDRLQKEALPPDDPNTAKWLTECFQWGVAIGLRRKLYERDPKRAAEILSWPP